MITLFLCKCSPLNITGSILPSVLTPTTFDPVRKPHSAHEPDVIRGFRKRPLTPERAERESPLKNTEKNGCGLLPHKCFVLNPIVK
ncbi:hypothetical protein TNCV_2370141 [Trichonephila clavipes]|nr:hypothetical protein TNCV_2370141 [Trichonephila clavipes]